MTLTKDVVVVGGGLGAVRIASALRERGHKGKLTLLSDESEWPYDRPPLTKQVLAGKMTADDIRLLGPAQADADRIDVQLRRRASGLDCSKREVILSNHDRISYDQLVVATGAKPRELECFKRFRNVHTLRTSGDASRLRLALQPSAHIVIIGAGFIGLEVASAAIKHGCNVTVVESAAVPLASVLGEEIGSTLRCWHERKGVKFFCGASVATCVSNQDQLLQVELISGIALPVDVLVVGVGQVPNTDWLTNSGLVLKPGLACDLYGRSSDPNVFGLGDVVSWDINGDWRATRHWTAVTEQAPFVAGAMLDDADGLREPDNDYFWSDQHGLRLQFIGRVKKDATLKWICNSPNDERYSLVAIEGGCVAGVFCLGCPRDFLKFSAQLNREFS